MIHTLKTLTGLAVAGFILTAPFGLDPTVAHTYPAPPGKFFIITAGAKGDPVCGSSSQGSDGNCTWRCNPSEAACATLGGGGTTITIEDNITAGGPGPDAYNGSTSLINQ